MATPLDTASEHGSIHVVRLLLQRGANIENRDKVRHGNEIDSVDAVVPSLSQYMACTMDMMSLASGSEPT